MLVIDCCIRGEDSYTRKYYQAYLAKVSTPAAYQVLELANLALLPLNYAQLKQREKYCALGEFTDPLFDLAKQFRDAEEILIAAPFWDLSFPSVLKVYCEWITVNGLTFGYDAEGQCHGYCHARKLLYFSTCGGYYGERHLGFEYIQALAAMLGIPIAYPYILQGMDLDPERREQLLAQAIRCLPEPPESKAL